MHFRNHTHTFGKTLERDRNLKNVSLKHFCLPVSLLPLCFLELTGRSLQSILTNPQSPPAEPILNNTSRAARCDFGAGSGSLLEPFGNESRFAGWQEGGIESESCGQTRGSGREIVCQAGALILTQQDG